VTRAKRFEGANWCACMAAEQASKRRVTYGLEQHVVTHRGYTYFFAARSWQEARRLAERRYEIRRLFGRSAAECQESGPVRVTGGLDTR
jgi:hypothetical protein